ncbi:MAG: hypothetical protein ACXABY_04260 [Candidatus Thorarchaeota archaeon]|jgi:type II secretory pathway component GspD/PulD (secretin)
MTEGDTFFIRFNFEITDVPKSELAHASIRINVSKSRFVGVFEEFTMHQQVYYHLDEDEVSIFRSRILRWIAKLEQRHCFHPFMSEFESGDIEFELRDLDYEKMSTVETRFRDLHTENLKHFKKRFNRMIARQKCTEVDSLRVPAGEVG